MNQTDGGGSCEEAQGRPSITKLSRSHLSTGHRSERKESNWSSGRLTTRKNTTLQDDSDLVSSEAESIRTTSMES